MTSKQRAVKYDVGGRQFYTKNEAIDVVSTILNSYNLYEYLNDDDAQFIYDVLKTHKEAELKIGCGVEAFQIMKAPFGKCKRFEIVRTDGSREDFSFRYCFGTPGLKPHQKFCSAMRGVIIDQISKFKKHSNAASAGDELHVDHVHPLTFEQLCFDFVCKHQIDLNSLEYVGDMLYEIVDKDIARAFYAYHKEHAVLQILSKLDNLKAPKSKLNWDELNNRESHMRQVI